MVNTLMQNDNSLDINLRITNKIFYNHIRPEIIKSLDNNIVNVSATTLKKFINEMNTQHYNILKNYDLVTQQLFILHQFCIILYHFNTTELNLSHIEFRAKILFPNLIYTLVRFLNNCHKFIQKNINQIYNEIKRKSYGIIKRYSSSYYLDEDIIKSDILYRFLGNALKKFNPLDINDINVFYRQIFRQSFFYYFKDEEQAHTIYSTLWDTDTNISKTSNIPLRLMLYRKVLYKLQIQSFCNLSPTLKQLNYNFGIFRNVIINNEFQDIVFSNSIDSVTMADNQYKLMKLHNNMTNETLLKIRNLPIIYKLLKSVHIINPNNKPYNESVIKPDIIKNAILEELSFSFKSLFNDEHIYGILDKISTNFVTNILSGEYINLLSLSNVKITHVSFINQIRQFIKICITPDVYERI